MLVAIFFAPLWPAFIIAQQLACRGLSLDHEAMRPKFRRPR